MPNSALYIISLNILFQSIPNSILSIYPGIYDPQSTVGVKLSIFRYKKVQVNKLTAARVMELNNIYLRVTKI